MNSFKLISLQGNVDSQLLLEISDKAYDILMREYEINTSVSQLPATATEVFLNETLKKAGELLAKNQENTTINVFGLFGLGYNLVSDESSEKGGNIVPAFIEYDGSEKPNKKDEELLMEIAHNTLITLEKENNVKMVHDETTYKVAKVFLETLIDRMKEEVVNNEKKSIVINVFDLFELGFDYTTEEDSEDSEPYVVYTFAALGAFKTAGKCDETQSGE